MDIMYIRMRRLCINESSVGWFPEQNDEMEGLEEIQYWLTELLNSLKSIKRDGCYNMFLLAQVRYFLFIKKVDDIAKECVEKGGFRKVMLDRLALLDRRSAGLFQLLCGLAYDIEVSDNRSYTLPLYLRGDTLQGMKNNGDIYSTEIVGFTLVVDEEIRVEVAPQYDKTAKVYYILTGNAVFTKMGLQLCHILKKNINRPDFFLRTVQAFMDYQICETI